MSDGSERKSGFSAGFRIRDLRLARNTTRSEAHPLTSSSQQPSQDGQQYPLTHSKLPQEEEFIAAPGDGVYNNPRQGNAPRLFPDQPIESQGKNVTKGHGDDGEPPDAPPTMEGFGDDDKESQINDIMRRKKEELDNWQSDIIGPPQLSVPDSAIGYFAPKELLRTLPDPEKLDIKIQERKRGTLEFFYTVPDPNRIPPETWEAMGRDDERPEDLDRMTARYAHHTLSLGPDDMPLVHIRMLDKGSPGKPVLFIDEVEINDNESLRENRDKIERGLHERILTFAKATGFKEVVAFDSAATREFGYQPYEDSSQAYSNIPKDVSALVFFDLKNPIPGSDVSRSQTEQEEVLPDPALILSEHQQVETAEDPDFSEQVDGRTIAERHHNDWPELHIRYLTGHNTTLGDMKDLDITEADVYLIEGDLALADRLNFIARPDQRRSDDETFLRGYDAEERGMGRPTVYGTALEAELRALHGSGKAVGYIDAPAGDLANSKALAEIDNAAYVDTDFSMTLGNLYDKLSTLAAKHQQRQSIAVDQQLEGELKRVFAAHPKLLEITDRPLRIVVKWNALDSEMLDEKIKNQELTTDYSTPQDLTYFPSELAIRKLMSGEQISQDDVAKVHLERVLFAYWESSFTEQLGESNHLARYFQYVTSRFSVEDIKQIHELALHAQFTPERLNWELYKKGFGPLPQTNEALVHEINNFERQVATERTITAFEHGDESTQNMAINYLAEIMTTNTDIAYILDNVSSGNPELAQDLSSHIFTKLHSRLYRLSNDNLVWIQANLPSNLPTSEIQTILRNNIKNNDFARAVQSASAWAEPGSKTLDRIKSLTTTMYDFGRWEGIDGHAEALDVEKIIINNIRDGHEVGKRQLRRFTAQPVIAERVSDPTGDDGTKAVILSHEDTTKRGSKKFAFEGDGPMGIVLYHDGIPQGIVSFDIKDQVIYIRQIEKIMKYFEKDDTSDFREVISMPTVFGDINFTGTAIDLVKNACNLLGLPRVNEGEPVVGERPDELPEINPTVSRPLEFRPYTLSQQEDANGLQTGQNEFTILVNVTGPILDDISKYDERLAHKQRK